MYSDSNPAAIASRFTNSARFTSGKLLASHLGSMPELPPKSSRIAIVNPVPGGARSLSYKHALRWVKQKRAEWCGRAAIRFLGQNHRHQSAQREALKQTAIGYDADRRIRTRQELKHVPFTGQVERLYIVRRKCAA